MAGSSNGLFGGGGWSSFILGETPLPFGLIRPPVLGWRGPAPPRPAIVQHPAAPAAQPPQGEGRAPAALPQGKRSAGRTWQEDEGARRGKVLRFWREAVSMRPLFSALGRQIAAAQTQAEEEASIEDAFRGKATATLERRAVSLKLFLRWAAVAVPSKQVPLEEGTLYRYARALAEEGAPPTRAQSMLEAARFVVGTWGCDVRLEDLVSARLLGATQASSDRKRLLKQRPPLQACTVAKLEAFMFSEAPVPERIMAGFVLFLVHCRFRCYDAVRLAAEPVLVEGAGPTFIETAGVSDFMKSGQAKRRRRRAVPVVGLACGALGWPWAREWLNFRAAAGLNAARDGTLAPAHCADGSWARAAVTSTEVNAWLKRFLASTGLEESSVADVGTHSCKPTLLSWAAKAGLRGEHRRMLGGHAKPKEFVMLEYSRDALSTPLLALDCMLSDLRAGRFDPEAGRGSYRGDFQTLAARAGLEEHEQEAVRAAAAEPPEGEGQEGGVGEERRLADPEASNDDGEGQGDDHAEPDDSGPDDSDESSGTTESEQESVDEEPPKTGASKPPTAKHAELEGRAVYKHPRLGTQHLAKKDAPDDLHVTCGKAKSSLDLEASPVDFVGPFCLRCFAMI